MQDPPRGPASPRMSTRVGKSAIDGQESEGARTAMLKAAQGLSPAEYAVVDKRAVFGGQIPPMPPVVATERDRIIRSVGLTLQRPYRRQVVIAIVRCGSSFPGQTRPRLAERYTATGRELVPSGTARRRQRRPMSTRDDQRRRVHEATQTGRGAHTDPLRCKLFARSCCDEQQPGSSPAP